jgi:hypothetical protein
MIAVRQAVPLLYRSTARLQGGSVLLKACTASFATSVRPSVTRQQPPTSTYKTPLANTHTSIRAAHTLKESYSHILVEKRFPTDSSPKGGAVGIIILHRPKALNALCDALFEDLIHAVMAFEEDEDVGCLVVTGSPKAFAAGEFDWLRKMCFNCSLTCDMKLCSWLGLP